MQDVILAAAGAAADGTVVPVEPVGHGHERNRNTT
jgi:hypothetical protein